MIVGQPYQRDNDSRTYLRNIHQAESVPPGYVDTGLAEFPGSEAGKPMWNGSRVVPLVLTQDEKLDRLALPPRVLAALVVGALPSADTTAAEKTWARGLLLEVRDRIRAARA